MDHQLDSVFLNVGHCSASSERGHSRPLGAAPLVLRKRSDHKSAHVRSDHCNGPKTDFKYDSKFGSCGSAAKDSGGPRPCDHGLV